MRFTKPLAGTLAAVCIAGTFAGAATPSLAGDGRHAAAAAGLLGGLAVGALAAGAFAGAPAPVYGPPVYAPPAPVYYDCGYRRVPTYDGWGNFAGYRVVPAC